MDKAIFKEAIGLLSDFTIKEIRDTRSGIMLILKNMDDEKKRVNAEVYKAMHNLNISEQSKKKRIEYIDEHLLPNIDTFNIQIISDFSDSKSNILSRIQLLQKEKKRIQKNSNEHALKARKNLRLLNEVYKEKEKIEGYLKILDTADVLYKFVTDNRLNVVDITLDEIDDVYRQYMNRGGR